MSHSLRLKEVLASVREAAKNAAPARAVLNLVVYEGGATSLAARSLKAADTDLLLTTLLGVIVTFVDEGNLIGGWPAFDEQLKIFREMRSRRPKPTVLS